MSRIGHGEHRIIITTNLVGPTSQTTYQGSRSSASIFKGLLSDDIWEWRPSWSRDQDRLNKLMFHHPSDPFTVNDIWCPWTRLIPY